MWTPSLWWSACKAVISQVYSIVLLLHEKFLGLTSPLLSSQQQIDLLHILKFGYSWTAQPPYAAAFLIFRAHLEEESILPRNSTTTAAFLPHSVRTHCSLKLRVPDHHWPTRPAHSRTYFTLVSGLGRPPRSFTCLHLLVFFLSQHSLKGPTTMGVDHLVEGLVSQGPCHWEMGVQLFLISERIYYTCSVQQLKWKANMKHACDISKTHAFIC